MSRSVSGKRKSLLSDKSYKLYAINCHGTGLNAIREEFIAQVKNGLRRSIFVIDMEEELKHYKGSKGVTIGQDLQSVSLRRKRKPSARKEQEFGNMDVLQIALTCIQKCQIEYEEIAHIIEQEVKFDLLNYWIKYIDANFKPKSSDRFPSSPKGKKLKSPKSSDLALQCRELKPKQHNKVGRPPLLSKRKVIFVDVVAKPSTPPYEYICDEPTNCKLLILLLGNFNNQFYFNLLSHNEPLQAIIHFLPEEGPYDLLVPSQETQRTVQSALETIDRSVYGLRQSRPAKPTGIFQYYLPVISKCLAHKRGSELFDQLSWLIYDIEDLYQLYVEYYVKVIKEIDIQMPKSIHIRDVYRLISSFRLEGQFLTKPMPAVGTDTASILLFMDGLLSHLGAPAETLTESETIILRFPPAIFPPPLFGEEIDILFERSKHAFSSITQIKKYERLFVEENNDLLCDMISYTDQSLFRNIHRTCLEYNIQRKYTNHTFVKCNLRVRPYDCDAEHFPLPQYAKFYPNHDPIVARLTKWLLDYDEFLVEEIRPNYWLYHFKRVYNEIIEYNKTMVIPTKLCFRDFTLFAMEEFQRDVITPEEYRSQLQSIYSEDERVEFALKGQAIEYDMSIFIRPLSLKERKWKEAKEEAKKFPIRLPSRKLSESSRKISEGGPSIKHRGSLKGESLENSRSKLSSRSARSLRNNKEDIIIEGIGLPHDHPLLHCYALEDVRHEVNVKTSRYNFHEGSLTLYEDCFCLNDVNKTLELSINNVNVNVYRPHQKLSGILHDMYVTTKSDISIHMLIEAKQCIKASLNYPNGLSIRYFDNYIQQTWAPRDTSTTDWERLYTAYGAVIVYYKKDRSIAVLRHNGEVYRLYPYLLSEETGEEELTYDTADDPTDIPTDQLTEQQSDSRLSSPRRKKRVTKSTGRGEGDSPRDRRKRGKRGLSETSKMAFSSHSEDGTEKSSEEKSEWILKTIQNEMKFFENISTLYRLTYEQLVVTSSEGKVVNVTKKGRAYMGRPLVNIEWHDYYADESYALREDDVKMVWNKEGLKCYHKDGTIMVSQIDEGFFEGFDELDSSITKSSSHMEFVMSSTTHIPSTAEEGGIPSFQSLSEVRVEETVPEDISYVVYFMHSYSIMHKNYAEVYFTNVDDLQNFIMDVRAADDIRVRITKATQFDEALKTLQNTERSISLSDTYEPASNFTVVQSKTNVPNMSKTDIGEDEELLEEEDTTKRVLNLWIGKDFHMYVTEISCEITASVTRYADDNGRLLDNLSLKFGFEDILTELFTELVHTISRYKNYKYAKSDVFYFVAKLDEDCNTVKGLQFYDRLPPKGQYSYSVSNTTTEFTELRSMDDKLANEYQWADKDLSKFPRFQPRKPKLNEQDKFPKVLSVNVYCKIPSSMANTQDITKFLENLDETSFKSTRPQIKSALTHYLEPHLENLVREYMSKKSWKRRHAMNRLRIFREQQRSGLYRAILKHKVYPKYFQFMNAFLGHAKYIDFFEFVVWKCKEPPPETRDDQSLGQSIYSRVSSKTPAESPTKLFAQSVLPEKGFVENEKKN